MIETVKVADTGIIASRIGLGTWAIGGTMWGGTDKKQAIETIQAALDKGITLIDTAPGYGFGVSETIVGEAVASFGKREDVVIATKAGLNWKNGQIFRDASQERITQEIEDSLKRLRTDYIDIYQIHWPDPLVPIEETAAIMKKLHEDGVIRAIGVSNFSPQQMDEFKTVVQLHTNQPPYNIFERGIEKEVLPYCEENNITTLLYGSLCRGLLSGRMASNTTFAQGDIRNVDPKFKAPRFSQYLKAVNKLDVWAKEKWGKSVIHVALRWMLDHSKQSIALWGARRPEQLEPVEGIRDWHLSSSDFEEIDKILIECVTDPVGPEFMAPPSKDEV